MPSYGRVWESDLLIPVETAPREASRCEAEYACRRMTGRGSPVYLLLVEAAPTPPT